VQSCMQEISNKQINSQQSPCKLQDSEQAKPWICFDTSWGNRYFMQKDVKEGLLYFKSPANGFSCCFIQLQDGKWKWVILNGTNDYYYGFNGRIINKSPETKEAIWIPSNSTQEILEGR